MPAGVFRWARRSTAPARIPACSPNAAGRLALLFDSADAPAPSRAIDLDPRVNRTYHNRHTFVPGVAAGQVYAYRISGPFDPERGLRFDPSKVCSILTASASLARRRERATQHEGRATTSRPRSGASWSIPPATTGRVTLDPASLREDHPRRNARGRFTRHLARRRTGQARNLCGADRDYSLSARPRRECGRASAGVSVRRGRWPAGARQRSGIRAAFVFAPHDGYSSRPDPLGALDEFRDMVKAASRRDRGHPRRRVHHSAESDENGPTISFRGLSNETYYILAAYRRATPISPAAAIRSTPTSRSSGASFSTAFATGSARCTSTASASTWPRCWRATRAAVRWHRC